MAREREREKHTRTRSRTNAYTQRHEADTHRDRGDGRRSCSNLKGPLVPAVYVAVPPDTVGQQHRRGVDYKRRNVLPRVEDQGMVEC